VKESRKKQREVEEKRLTAERAAEEARRKADEVPLCYDELFLIRPTVYSFAELVIYVSSYISHYQYRHRHHRRR